MPDGQATHVKGEFGQCESDHEQLRDPRNNPKDDPSPWQMRLIMRHRRFLLFGSSHPIGFVYYTLLPSHAVGVRRRQEGAGCPRIRQGQGESWLRRW